MAEQKTVRIKWVRSGIGFTHFQKSIVRSVGLNKLNRTVVRPDTAQIRGIVASVPHLLEIVPEPTPAAWASVPEYTVHPAAPAEAPVAAAGPKAATEAATDAPAASAEAAPATSEPPAAAVPAETPAEPSKE